MSLPITDAFNQNSGSAQTLPTYAATWSLLEGDIVVPTGNLGIFQGNGATYNSGRNNSETFSADQYSQIVWATPGGYYMGPLVRGQSGANTSYHVDSDGSAYYVSKCVAGSQSTLVGPVSISLSSGDVLRLEVSGTGATVTLKIYKALAASPTTFVQQGSDVTDTAGDRITTAGYAGVFFYGSTGTYGGGAWEAGNLGGGGPTGSPWNYYAQQ